MILNVDFFNDYYGHPHTVWITVYGRDERKMPIVLKYRSPLIGAGERRQVTFTLPELESVDRVDLTGGESMVEFLSVVPK